MTAFKVGGDNWPVLLLAGSVPNVEFGEFVVEVDIFDFEVDGSDLGLLLSEEVTLGESPKQSCLTHITVADKNELILFLLSVWKIPLFDHDEVKGLSLIRCIICELIINCFVDLQICWFILFLFIFYLFPLPLKY